MEILYQLNEIKELFVSIVLYIVKNINKRVIVAKIMLNLRGKKVKITSLITLQTNLNK